MTGTDDTKKNDTEMTGTDDTKKNDTEMTGTDDTKKISSLKLFMKRIFRSKRKPPSLINIGANYYLNSALQGISSCNGFVKDITKLVESENTEKLRMFNNLILALNGDSSKSLEISRNTIFQNWNKPGQQDSFELMCYVLNEVYNEIREKNESEGKIKKRSIKEWITKITLPLRIIIQYQIKCGCNDSMMTPLQTDLALHVPIKNKDGCNDLKTLLEEFFMADKITDYDCDNKDCDGKNAVRIAKLIEPLPRTLCIHLQRSYWNGRRMVKDSAKVNFDFSITIINDYIKYDEPNVLDTMNNIKHDKDDQGGTQVKNRTHLLKNKNETNENKLNDDYVVRQKESKNLEIYNSENKYQMESTANSVKKTRSLKSRRNSEHSTTYNLTAVIVHYGSVGGGHYVCYKRVQNNWFSTNDSRIDEVTEKDVMQCDPYILFYEKSEIIDEVNYV